MSRRAGVLRVSMTIDVARPAVFTFFSHAENLEAITPPELRFRIMTPPPIVMRTGTLIDYALKLYGVPIRWQTLISRWEPPGLFVDEQLRGPYRRWIHTHRFTEAGRERTLVEDEVHYELPLGRLGALGGPVVAGQLARIFRYRQAQVSRLLGATPPALSSPGRHPD